MKLTLSRQLIAVALLVTGLTAGSTWMGYRGASNLSDANQRMNMNAQALHNHMEGDMMHDALRSDVLAALLDGKDSENRTTVLQDLKDHGEHFKEALALNGKLPLEPAIRKALTNIRPLLDKYIEQAGGMVDAAYNHPDKVKALKSKFDHAFSDLEDAQAEVSNLIVAENDKATAAALAASKEAKAMTIAAGFFIVLISLPLSIYTGRRIARRMEKLAISAETVRTESVAMLQEAMSRLAEGDLTARYTVSIKHLNDSSHDEIGQLSRTFDAMTTDIAATMDAYDEARGGLSQLVGSVSQTVGSLSRSSKALSESTAASSQSVDYIATGSEQLAQNATEGANVTAQLSKSAAAVAEGSERQLRSVTQAAESLREAQVTLDGAVASATSVADAADRGGQTVAQTEGTMRQIEGQAQASARKVEELDEQGKTIGTIVVTIEGIAEQTNLLALNAAIEAARAGEHGKGFAVVADEVRKLAEQSKLATQQIGELIHRLRSTVSETVTTIEEMNDEVKQGAVRTAETGTALRNILTSVRDVAGDIRKAATASTVAKSQIEALAEDAEQSRTLAAQMSDGAQMVLEAVTSVAAVSEETAASVQEMTATSETISNSALDLDRLATDLHESVSHFRVESAGKPPLRIAA